MKSVINELYNGEIFPVEAETLKDEKYRRTVNRIGHEIEELMIKQTETVQTEPTGYEI